MSAQAYYHALRAALAKAKGDLPAAAEALQLALVYDHESLELTLRLGRISLSLDRVGRARKMADKARQLGARRSGVALLRADVALAEGRIEKARRILVRAERRETEGIDIALKLGRLFLAQGEAAAAIPVLRRAVNRLPQSTEPLQVLAEVHRALGDLPGATKALSRALARSSADTSVRILLSDSYEREGNLSEAFALWKAYPEAPSAEHRGLLTATGVALLLKAEAPKLLPRLLELARTQAQREAVALMLAEVGQLETALPLLEEVSAKSPTPGTVDLVLGRTLYGLGKDKKALSVLEGVGVNTRAAYVPARALVAEIHIAAGRHKRAHQALLVALRHFPNEATLVGWLAVAHARGGDRQQALRAIDDAGLRDSLIGLRTRALIQSEANGLEATIEGFEVQLKNSTGPQILVRRILGELELRRGRFTQAEAWFKQVGSGRIDDAELAGDLGLASSRPRAGLRFALRGLALSPRSPSVLHRLGRVYLRAGDLAHARAYLLRARRLGPRDPIIMEHTGDLHLRAGELELANGAWRDAQTNWRQARRAKDPRARAALARLGDKLKGAR